jgi:hypothetical protein
MPIPLKMFQRTEQSYQELFKSLPYNLGLRSGAGG